MANAVNIIDGFNGLASGSVGIMLLGLAGLAWISHDPLLIALCLFVAAAMPGFMVLNFPFGKIFLGDGGAYLAGFWLAECAVLLVVRNPEVSTWAVLLCCIYPIWETLFSIWRKSFYRKTGMGRPDRVHFHMLMYRRLVSQRVGRATAPWIKHGLSSGFIWCLVIACQSVSVLFTYSNLNATLMMLGLASFCVAYVWFYRRAVFGAIYVEHGNEPLGQ
jgi:UDP-N-acetylmuramyl pentapeptide phosphotransferase/UDP-N-acetylglucosamine-1-phosphate transferase